MREIELETLSTKKNLDIKRWTALIEASPTSDVYYFPEYAEATAEIEQTEAMALFSHSASMKILAPLLLRRLSSTIDGRELTWLDAYTPYGYGGLLTVSPANLVTREQFHGFIKLLNTWCLDRDVVCCVIRLHPLIEQQDWVDIADLWQGRLQLHSRGTTTSIDLYHWDETLDLPAKLRRDRRADFRLASRNLRVTWCTGEDVDATIGLDMFSMLYREFIERNGAESFYKFPQTYFTKLRALGKRLGVALAWHGDQLAGGNLFLVGQRYAHGHLAATNDMGRKFGASSFLIVEGARWARHHGCELLHLGGGARPEDSLEAFKQSFGGILHIYRYVKFIADEQKFAQICNLSAPPWPYIAHANNQAANNGKTT